MRSKLLSSIIDIIENSQQIWEPSCDIYEKDNFIVCELDIPGLDINTLSINIYNATTVVILGKKSSVNPKKAVYLRAERIFGQFKKTIEFNCCIKGTKTIEYAEGILKITFYKR